MDAFARQDDQNRHVQMMTAVILAGMMSKMGATANNDLLVEANRLAKLISKNSTGPAPTVST